MLQKILLAYDGSAEGKAALVACAESYTVTETHLLAVAEYPTVFLMNEGMAIAGLMHDAIVKMQAVLAEGIEQLQQKGHITTGHLAVGRPVDEICRFASLLNADLIVLGHTRKSSFVARWWSDSVGRSLVDHAPCNVLVAYVDS